VPVPVPQLLPPTVPLAQKHWNDPGHRPVPPVQLSPGCGSLPQSIAVPAPPAPPFPVSLQLIVPVRQ
jgi:hypothetical protein